MLSVSEFRCILAHEFAHFYAGDTKLGPWVFKARMTMARVLTKLGKKSALLSVVTRFLVVALLYTIVVGGLIFYWKMFNRLTQFISRKQEFRCDELACYLGGSQNFENGLVNVNKASAAFGAYWRDVVAPVVGSGHCPHLADGFARFMNAPHILQATTKFMEDRLATAKTDPMDSHPPLNERIEKARALAIVTGPSDDRPMISIMDNLQALEVALIKKLAPGLKTPDLKWTGWDAAGFEIYIPLWRGQTAPYKAALQKMTMLTLPTAVANPADLAGMITNPPGLLLSGEQRAQIATQLIVAAFTLSLIDHGWHLHIQPGIYQVESGESKLEPANLMNQFRTGKMSLQAWAQYCEKAGIGDWYLSSEPESAMASSAG
jgi:hypothetical protein